MVRSSSSMEYIEEFPAAYPDRIDHSPPLQVADSASVLDTGIPLPDLPQGLSPSCSSLYEDVEVLTPIGPDTTEPYQTMCTIVNNTRYFLPLHKAGLSEDANKMSPNQTQPCLQTPQTLILEAAQMLSRADTGFSRNVSFEKTKIPGQAEVIAIEKLSWTSSSAVASLDTTCTRDTSPEATSSNMPQSNAARLLPTMRCVTSHVEKWLMCSHGSFAEHPSAAWPTSGGGADTSVSGLVSNLGEAASVTR
ncbi:hypothetical protein MRX96_009877 [Rhipicephalus microplus]